jgi:acetyl esterase/lipase
MSAVAATTANASTGFQLLPNPSNPSEAEVQAALKLVRAGGITYPQTAKPDRTATTPSTTLSAPRDVKLDIYDPAGLDDSVPRTVVVTWHGSGYVVPRFGADADVNRWLSDELHVTVVDGDYVKAPEFRFPEPLYDVVAAVRWVVQQPWFDGNLIVKGHSAGAQFALAMANRSTALSVGLTADEYAKIKACVTLYPPTDSSIPLIEKPTNEQGELPGIPMSALSHQIMHFFFGALLGWDAETQQKMGRDPRVSPAFAPTEAYEVPCYVIACEHDPLGPEAVAFANKLHEHNPVHELYFAKGVGHSFETRIPDVRASDVLDHPGGKSKKESFEGMLAFIRKHVPSIKA